MKTTIKTFVAAILGLGFGSFANAQSASISANATVISEIEVENVNNLNFGTLVAGQIKSVLLGGVEVSTGPLLGTANRGEFIVAAQAGSDVRLSFNLPDNLNGPSGALLPISFFWINEFDVPQLTVRIFFSNGAFITVNPNNPISFPDNSFPTSEVTAGKNSVRLTIGGKVDATSATAGSYTGTITLNATYN
jgi:spore coat protein U-like protein